MQVSLAVWVISIVAVLALVALDFLTISRKPHEVRLPEAAGWSIFYIGIAVAFGIGLFIVYGGGPAGEFAAAYLVEKSLSVDNLFVFVIILGQFAVPSILHQRVLLIGVVLALVLRGIFIAIGAAALAAFAFTFVIFGAILIWTGIQLARHRNDDPSPREGVVVRTVRRIVPMTEDFDGPKIFTRQNGRRIATPMLLVVTAIASTDLLFALDSIPATFGVTTEPYLVFAANALALLGLRALYFLLRGLLDRLIYLSTGLAVILVFIGVKLILTYVHEINAGVPKIPTPVSLGVICGVLVVVTVASWLRVRRNPELRAHAGTVTSPSTVEEDSGSAPPEARH